jgi:hypothetical protein
VLSESTGSPSQSRGSSSGSSSSLAAGALSKKQRENQKKIQHMKDLKDLQHQIQEARLKQYRQEQMKWRVASEIRKDTQACASPVRFSGDRVSAGQDDTLDERQMATLRLFGK